MRDLFEGAGHVTMALVAAALIAGVLFVVVMLVTPIIIWLTYALVDIPVLFEGWWDYWLLDLVREGE